MIGVVLFAILICVYVAWAYKVYFKGSHELPPIYPNCWPIIGHLHLMVGDGRKLWDTLTNTAAESIKRGGVTALILGKDIYYLITDPEDALTAANACLQKHFAYDFSKQWLGEGLITGSGEIWQRHRKLLTPAFGLPVVNGFQGVFNSQSRKLVEELKREVGKPFDHFNYLRNITLETFCLTAFGIDNFEDKDFIMKYMEATDNILNISTSRFQNLWLQSDIIFKLCGYQKKFDEFVKIVNDMSYKVIEKKKSTMHSGYHAPMKSTGIRYKPFLDLLLELSENNALSDKEIREEVDTAIVTGFDTTSNVLSYLMVLLGRNPAVQEKVYQEIKNVFKTDREVDKEDFQNLVYTEAVIKETLRCITSGPITLRYVDKDVKLKNYTMRAGSQCIIALFGVHRDPVWGKDADEFRPERWLNPEQPISPTAFVGFSLGKRSCLGKTYAMLTAKTMVVHIVRRYKITTVDPKLEFSMEFILRPVSGHKIILEERE